MRLPLTDALILTMFRDIRPCRLSVVQCGFFLLWLGHLTSEANAQGFLKPAQTSHRRRRRRNPGRQQTNIIRETLNIERMLNSEQSIQYNTIQYTISGIT